MWVSILAIVGEILKFLCKWGSHKIDTDTERKKKREAILQEAKGAKTQADMLRAINEFNSI